MLSKIKVFQFWEKKQMLESTEINHKKDFSHCKEWDDRNVSIGFKLVVNFFFFLVYSYFKVSQAFAYYKKHIKNSSQLYI